MVSISTFTGFLISGLVIIAIFSIVGGFFQPPAPAEKISLTKSIPLEFSISKLRESKEVRMQDMVLHNGLLFGSNELKYNLSLPNDTESVVVSFDVTRTNLYAPLVIKADGFSESRKLPKGSYSFDIGKKENNVIITIQPDSSLWRIWAPALYEINNTKAAISAFKTEKSGFSFNLDKELPAESANLILQFDKSTGVFMAELNGNALHSGTVKAIETIPVNTTLLANENTLVFAAANNSQFAGRGTLVINYKG